MITEVVVITPIVAVVIGILVIGVGIVIRIGVIVMTTDDIVVEEVGAIEESTEDNIVTIIPVEGDTTAGINLNLTLLANAATEAMTTIGGEVDVLGSNPYLRVNPIFKRVHCLAKQYDFRRNEEICFV